MVQKKLNRIWHNHSKWEDAHYGMYDSITDKKRRFELLKKVKQYFSNKKLYSKYMKLVIQNWKYSCEHNLTNPSMNHIAWLGQASACLYCKAPEDITREAWSLLQEY